MAKLAELLVTLGIDSASFNSDLDKALGKSLTFKNAWGVIGKAVVSAGALAGTAFAGMARAAINAADDLGNLAQSAGVTTETLSSMAYAGESAGVSAEELAGGFQKLANTMADAADGTGAGADAFKALGIAVKNTDGTLRASDAVLLDVAEKFAQYSDGAEKTALAQDLFGKSGAALIPMLNMGADGIRRMQAEAEGLGLVIRTDTAAAASEFNTNLGILQGAMKGVVMQTTNEMLPVLVQLSGTLAEDAKQSGGLQEAVSMLAGAFKALASVGIVVKNVFDIVGELLGSSAAAFMLVLDGQFKAALAVIRESNDKLELEIEDIADGLGALWGETAKRIEKDAPSVAKKIAAPIVQAKEQIKAERDQVAEMLRSLENQAATFGMTDTEREAHDLLMAGATEDQLRYGLALRGTIDEMEAQKEAEEELARLRQRNIDEVLKSIDSASVEVSEFAQEASRQIENTLADFLFDPFKDGLDGMLEQFGDVLRRMVADAAAAQIAETLFGKSGGQGGGWMGQLGTFLNAAFGSGSGGGGEPFGAVDFNAQPDYGLGPVNYGGRAIGGSVFPGQMYEVGENGPEWFVPEMNGRIVTDAGGPVIHQHFTVMAPEGRISKATDQQFRMSAFQAGRDAMRRNG